MPKKKRASNKQQNLNIGNFTNISGEINIAGRDNTSIKHTTAISAAQIKQLLDQLYSAIESRTETPTSDREDLKAEVKEIQSTVTEAAKKNGKVDEGFLARRFRNIARMAPDILDVVVATLGNPLAGLGVAVKKIAEKAKEEAKASWPDF